MLTSCFFERFTSPRISWDVQLCFNHNQLNQSKVINHGHQVAPCKWLSGGSQWMQESVPSFASSVSHIPIQWQWPYQLLVSSVGSRFGGFCRTLPLALSVGEASCPVPEKVESEGVQRLMTTVIYWARASFANYWQNHCLQTRPDREFDPLWFACYSSIVWSSSKHFAVTW